MNVQKLKVTCIAHRDKTCKMYREIGAVWASFECRYPEIGL